MSDPNLTPEDTAALRAQPGDWREYLRSEMNRGRARREQPATKPKPQPPPGHRPGAWPPGTRPPAPPPPIPDAEVQRALAEYRQWVDDGRPRIDAACECEPCRLLGPNHELPWRDE